MKLQNGKSSNKAMGANLWVLILVFLAVTIFFIVIHLKLREYAFDDAYIHFRIAENLVRCAKPYFNCNQAVMASSSSGWTIILGIFYFVLSRMNIGSMLPLAVSILNALILSVTVFTYTYFLSMLSENPKKINILIPYSILLVALLIQPSIGLMETPSALLLVGVGLVLLMYNKPYCLIFWGLAIHFRLETSVVFVLFFSYAGIKKLFSLKQMITYSLLGILPILIYDLYYFGTLIPNTIIAKSTVYTLTYADVISPISKFLLPDFALAFSNFRLSINVVYKVAYLFGSLIFLAFIFLYQLTRYLPERMSKTNDELIMLIYLWGMLVLISYLFAKAHIFSWYMPIISVPISLAIAYTMINESELPAVLFLIILTMPILITQYLSLIQVNLAAFVSRASYQEFETGARVRHYRQKGMELYKKYPDATLLTSEIGGLGYTFRGNLLDGAGLVSPEALKYHPMEVPEERSAGYLGAIPVEFILEEQPELIVSYDTFIEGFLNSEAINLYERFPYDLFLEEDMTLYKAKKYSSPFWGSEHLNVFIRKDYYKEEINLSQ